MNKQFEKLQNQEKKVIYIIVKAYYLLFIQILKNKTFLLMLFKFLIIIINKNMKLFLSMIFKLVMVC